MATRFHFTTRDWFWLCLVLFLTMGWGSHVRYSMWYENYANRPEPVTDDDLKAMMNQAIHKEKEARAELDELNYAILNTLDYEHRAKLSGKRKWMQKCGKESHNP